MVKQTCLFIGGERFLPLCREPGSNVRSGSQIPPFVSTIEHIKSHKLSRAYWGNRFPATEEQKVLVSNHFSDYLSENKRSLPFPQRTLDEAPGTDT